jgi:hypothetical protein
MESGVHLLNSVVSEQEKAAESNLSEMVSNASIFDTINETFNSSEDKANFNCDCYTCQCDGGCDCVCQSNCCDAGPCYSS